jgi:hypothetical protein
MITIKGTKKYVYAVNAVNLDYDTIIFSDKDMAEKFAKENQGMVFEHEIKAIPSEDAAQKDELLKEGYKFYRVENIGRLIDVYEIMLHNDDVKKLNKFHWNVSYPPCYVIRGKYSWMICAAKSWEQAEKMFRDKLAEYETMNNIKKEK